MGVKHTTLSEVVSDTINSYLEICQRNVTSIIASSRKGVQSGVSGDDEEAIRVAATTASLLGFLSAAANYTVFWSASQRLHLIESLRDIISEDFLVCVESTFSTIRNAHESSPTLLDWKRYAQHYAAAGRPFGAMLLQQGYLRLVVRCISLEVADAGSLRQADVLDILISQQQTIKAGASDEGLALVEIVTEVVIEQMRVLEDGSDYLQLGSLWQQRLAFSVKASALTSFLVCLVIEGDLADADTLMSWLETTMADAVQMADEVLATVVLRSMAIVARLVSAAALTLSRSLPRFIVQGGARGEAVAVAAHTLACILQRLSQDAIITTLYSLGNVISSGGNADKVMNGSMSPESSIGRGRSGWTDLKQPTGSAISLLVADDEESTFVYGNVVQAIVGVAKTCKDDKITALTQSMLIQKIGRINVSVDARIIAEAAVLATCGGPLELRSLLNLFSKLSRDGIIDGNSIILRAVSPF